MDIITLLYLQIDKVMMPFYRFTENNLFGYFLGTFLLCLTCVIIGEYSISLGFRLNKKDIVRDNDEMASFQDLSIIALKADDKSSYKACNRCANEAFGRSFFSQIALSAASLWPVFIALGWMQYRFSEVTFSLLPLFSGTIISIGYVTTFILCYLLARMIFVKTERACHLKRLL
jgi:hypothetical protein